MADTPDYFGNAMAANDEMIGQLQQANANYKPQGIFANVDPTMLSLAQGLLAPTKTGGFGESVSNAAGAVAGPLAAMKQAQMTNLEKIAALKNAQARLAMEAPYYQSRGDYYGARADMPFGGTGGSEASQYNAGTLAISRRLKELDTNDPNDAAEIETLKQAQRQLNAKYSATLPKLPTPDGSTGAPAPATPAPAASSPGIIDTISNWWNGTPPASQAPAQPAPAQPAAPKQQPAQEPAQDQTAAPTVGSTKKVKVGKDNLTATYAPDGKWYVTKDGKHYPVVE